MEPTHARRGLALSLPVVSSSNPSKGFTLIELLVVLAIMTFIMSIVLVGQSSFDKTIILESTAYDIALTLRSAETYGISSRGLSTAANVGYGVNFNAATPGSLTLFSDAYPPVGSGSSALCHTPPGYDSTGPDAKPGDCAYNPGSSFGETVRTYQLGNKMFINNFCSLAGGNWSCASDGSISSLDIVFARPNPDAFMSVNGVYRASSPVTEACISVSSPRQDATRVIRVLSSGQIAVNSASCP